MEFTPRTKQILTVLLQENGSISVKNLAEKVGISKRTVQRELEYMNSDLKPFELCLMSKTGVGIWLEGSEEKKKALFTELSAEDTYDMSNREERRKRLLLEILKDKGLKKLFYYSSKFKVSEATISTDLEALEGWLGRYGLVVLRKPGSGISIQGNEESYRKAIRAFISENIDTSMLREAYENDGVLEQNEEKLQRSTIGQILNDDILKRVVNCILGMGDSRVMTLTESSYVGLVIHVSIAINRILKHETIEADVKWAETMEQDGDYELAQQIAKELEKEFKIEMPAVEVSYICLHIKGAKHEKIQWNGEKTLDMENRELQKIVNEMIDVFDDKSAFMLKQDEEFIQGLLAHLQPTLIRLLYDMQIANPVLEEIKKDYAEIFEKCKLVSKVLESKLGKEVPETEVGFLAVHFGAAMVRLEGKREEIRKVQIGVVCSSGIGISRLMSSKLEKAFHDRVKITAYGKKDLTPYVIGKMDFFVSSISLEQMDAKILFVNPLLSEEDMKQVSRLVYQYERTPGKKEENRLSVELEEINILAAQINAVIKYMELIPLDEGITFDQLLEKVSSHLTPYQDQEQMIQEDIRKREKIASQVFAEFGFALFHTRTKGVTRPVFTVCMTQDGKPFADPYFKNIPVLFFMLVPVDDYLKMNSEILGYISSMLIENFQFMDVVLEGEEEKIRAALSRELKKFFTKYISGV